MMTSNTKPTTDQAIATFKAAVADMVTQGSIVPADLVPAFRAIPNGKRAEVQTDLVLPLMKDGNADLATQLMGFFGSYSELAEKVTGSKAATRVVWPEATEMQHVANVAAYYQSVLDWVGSRMGTLADALGMDQEAFEALVNSGDAAISRESLDKVIAVVEKRQPKPKGNGSGTRTSHSVSLADMVDGGTFAIGEALYRSGEKVATIAAQGKGDDRKVGAKVGGTFYSNLSAAAKAIVGHEANGWATFDYKAADGTYHKVAAARATFGQNGTTSDGPAADDSTQEAPTE